MQNNLKSIAGTNSVNKRNFVCKELRRMKAAWSFGVLTTSRSRKLVRLFYFSRLMLTSTWFTDTINVPIILMRKKKGFNLLFHISWFSDFSLRFTSSISVAQEGQACLHFYPGCPKKACNLGSLKVLSEPRLSNISFCALRYIGTSLIMLHIMAVGHVLKSEEKMRI